MITEVIGLLIPWDKVDTEVPEQPDDVIWYTPITASGNLDITFTQMQGETEVVCTHLYATNMDGDDLGDVVVAVRALVGKMHGQYPGISAMLAHIITDAEYEVHEIPTVEFAIDRDEEEYDRDLDRDVAELIPEEEEEEYWPNTTKRYTFSDFLTTLDEMDGDTMSQKLIQIGAVILALLLIGGLILILR